MMNCAQSPIRLVLLQAGGAGHFGDTACAVRERFPKAELIGFLKEADQSALESVVRWGALQAWDGRTLPKEYTSLGTIDFALLPVEDRFGVRFWHARWAAFRLGAKRVVLVNRAAVWQEAGRFEWLLRSVWATGVLRVAQLLYHLMVAIWRHVRRVLDIAGLFGLALMAIVLKPFHIVGAVPWSVSKTLTRTEPRRRLVLFIPSLGMGGAQRQLASFLQYLDRSRWHPVVVTLDTIDTFFEADVRAQGVEIVKLDPQCRFTHTGVVVQLIRYLAANPAHVLHSWLHYAVALGTVAGGVVGIPAVIGSYRSERPSLFPWFYPRWQRGIDILTARVQDLVIGNSDAVSREAQAWAFVPRAKLATVYNGIEVAPLKPVSPEHRKVLFDELGIPLDGCLVGTVGRLFPEKDQITLIDAAAQVCRARPGVHFVIIGEGSSRPLLEARIRSLNVSDRVHLAGGRKDAVEWMQVMSVFVLTSLSEGFPNVLLEAARAGVPTVTTAAGGAAEVVLDGVTGYVVPCRDSQGLAERILELLSNPARGGELARAATVRLQTCFDAKLIAKAIEDCYDRVESEKGRPGVHTGLSPKKAGPIAVGYR